MLCLEMYDIQMKWAMCNGNEVFILSQTYDTMLFSKKAFIFLYFENEGFIFYKTWYHMIMK